MGFDTTVDYCFSLANNAKRIWEQSLGDLARNQLSELLNDFWKIREDYKNFQSKCYGRIDSSIYLRNESIFNIALLKLSIAIEDKVKDKEIQDEGIKFILGMFSSDEKNIIREFEKFSGLDPKVVPPDLLADIIVSGKGEIYQLVKEAVGKQYTDFANLVKSWSYQYKISDSIRRGILERYEARFKNVVEAVKRLLDQQPAWVRRLFAEYEDALLSSAEVRSEFEKKFKEVYEKDANNLKEYMNALEKERNELLDKLTNLTEKASAKEMEAKLIEEELNRLRRDYEELRNRYFEYLKNWEANAKELELLKNKLTEKEKELEELAKKEKELTVAREAYEGEIARLKNLVNEYEAKVKEYERYKEELQLELESMRDKVNTLEKSMKGEIQGNLVTAEDATMLELIFIEKLRSKLNELPILIKTSWGDVVINKWSYVRIQSENLEQSTKLPSNKSIVFGYRSRGILGLGEEKVVEIRGVYLSHVDILKKQGLDIQPATLSDLINVLKNSLTTDGGKRFILIGIASPTGWDSSVEKYVTGGSYSLVFRDAIVVLVDLIENKVIYPEKLRETMPTIERYARMFIPEIRVEEEAKIEQTIKDLCDEAYAKSPDNPVFLYQELLDRLKGYSSISVTRVLNRYLKNDYIEIKNIKGVKTVICRSRK
jgi:predicted  nucleic acid-binding Zn-ribbon protein